MNQERIKAMKSKSKAKKTKTYKYDFSFNFRVYEYPTHGGFGIHETHYKGKRIIWVEDRPQSIVGWTAKELRAEVRNRALALKAPVLKWSRYCSDKGWKWGE